jgi:heat shock protein HslJ
MKKNSILLMSLVLIIIGCFIYTFNFRSNNVAVIQDFSHDGTYVIAGQKVTIKNGISEVPAAPGSSSKVITKYFGNDLKHDLNEDGREDRVFILTQNTGGSGTFYYVVALLDTASDPVGSEGVLLGDRIAPQTINIDEGKTTNGTSRQNVIVVNYADRKPGESFAIAPSVGKSIWLKLDPKTMQFGEVAQNFEGEASPSKITLSTKSWSWVNTTYSDGKIITPHIANKFILTMKNNKTFSAATDCNGVGGEYTTTGHDIIFTRMMSTMMYCEGSQESDFANMLAETQSYFFTANDELVFNLKFDRGSVVFN